MAIEITDIKWLHVELSSKCNAWCPACPRNNNGYGIANNLIEQDLSVDRLEEILSLLPNLHAVQFCGNFGDPIIAHNILDAINISKKYSKKIQIHTNGGLRNTNWWKNLAVVLSDIDHNVWFGIDGIGEIHEIYRQGTSYQKVIDNATAFINQGGIATWQFIPYAHNEHQIKDCIVTSQKLKFSGFKLVKSYRNIQLARNYKTGKEFKLLPTKELQTLIKIPKENTYVDIKNCMHLEQPSIYLAANGKISTCCYFSELNQFDNVIDALYSININHQHCITTCGS